MKIKFRQGVYKDDLLPLPSEYLSEPFPEWFYTLGGYYPGVRTSDSLSDVINFALYGNEFPKHPPTLSSEVAQNILKRHTFSLI